MKKTWKILGSISAVFILLFLVFVVITLFYSVPLIASVILLIVSLVKGRQVKQKVTV